MNKVFKIPNFSCQTSRFLFQWWEFNAEILQIPLNSRTANVEVGQILYPTAALTLLCCDLRRCWSCFGCCWAALAQHQHWLPNIPPPPSPQQLVGWGTEDLIPGKWPDITCKWEVNNIFLSFASMHTFCPFFFFKLPSSLLVVFSILFSAPSSRWGEC